ncbi:MAG: MFS transporter [Pseudomonadota bacterium]
MNNQTDYVRWTEIVNAEFGWPLFIICFGVTLHALDALVVATMLPAMVSDVGGLNLVYWTIGVYEIGTVLFSAMTGLVTIRFGVRRPMVFASTLFGSGCVISAVAPSMEIVLIGRLLQGFGGGGLFAISYVASALLFPQRTLARVMGAISIFWGAAGFLGPMLGSIFVEFLTWRIGFWCFGIAAFLLSALILLKISGAKPQEQQELSDRYPFGRILALTLGIFLIAAAGINVDAIKSPLLISAGILGIGVFLVADNTHEKSRLLPEQPLNFLKPMGSAITMIVCLAAATVALHIYGALILTSIHGASTLTAGYVIACPAIGWALATILVSGSPERLDRKMIKVSLTIATVGIAGFVYAIPNGPILLIAACAFTEGVGFGVAWAFIPRLIRHISKPDEIERNTGAIPTAQAIGYALGAAFVGIVGNWSGIEEGHSGEISIFAATAIFLFGAPLSLFGLFAMKRFVK